MVRRNEREGGFWKEKKEVEGLERIWRDEEDEEKEKKKETVSNRLEKNEGVGMHLVTKLHVV